jgi:branched-subunit amino acid aminotransferase/4-amino-4-deoxychorismate lyase
LIVNLDGVFTRAEQAGLPVNDGAVLYGDTLFETLKLRDSRIHLLTEHLDRLEMSAALLAFPCDRHRIHEALEQTAVRAPWPIARLRLTLSRGIGTGLDAPPTEQARFIITAAAYREPDAEQRAAGATCVFAPNRRCNPLSHLPQMKRGNYADCLYAARHAHARGAREALFRTDDGQLLEGATSNLFLNLNGVLVTPPAGERVLAGVMRRQVLQTAAHLGMATEERPVAVKELFQADEAFLTNALIDLLPIARVDCRPLRRGNRYQSLLEECRR